jgi:DNA polymerase-3 subunit epsilon
MRWPLLRRHARPSAEPTRWVVVDVESSGLDPARDRLLAIAGVALQVDWARRRLAINAADSFEVVLRQPLPSERDNILLHGIGVQRQLDGVDPGQAMGAFAAYARDAPLLAFHAAFDRELVGRYLASSLGHGLPNPWLDIEHLCAALHPTQAARSLDDWLQRLGIACMARHEAAADAWSECELMLRLWPAITAECGSWRELERLARHHRWLRRS